MAVSRVLVGSRLYAMFATPMAYLIDETGIITRDVAVGVDKIIDLMHNAKELVAAQARFE